MKKNYSIVLISFIITLLFGCNSDDDDKIYHYSPADNSLIGYVKSYTELSYKTVERFGKIEKGAYNYGFKEIMDVNGNLIKAYSYAADKTIIGKRNYQYNNHKNIIEVKYFNPKGKLLFKREYIYNDKEMLIEISRHAFIPSLKDRERHVIYKYCENGLLAEIDYYDRRGSLKQKTINKYDEKRRKIESFEYSSYGSLRYSITYEYDEFDNMVQTNRYKHYGSFNDTQKTYTYDNNGNLIEESKYELYQKSTGPFSSINRLSRIMNYIYDENGRLIRKTFNKLDGGFLASYAYEYDYDKQGNWIKRIQFENGVPRYILIREIEYYD